MAPLSQNYSGAHGLALMEQLDEAGKLVFTSADAREAASHRAIPVQYVLYLLLRLEAAGWIRRVKRGVYAITGKLAGSSSAHDYAIAVALFPPSALSHQTALNLHGLSEQIPRVITCTTTAKVVTPAMRGRATRQRMRGTVWEVDGLRVRLVSVRPSRFFGITEVWADSRTRVPVTDRERTVLDLFIDPARFGGLGEALGILEEHRASLDLTKLVGYAIQLRVASVAKRLGWALESFGTPEVTIAPLLAVEVAGVQPLDMHREHRGRVIDRWKLQDNLAAPIRR